jgi:hypothetical protein
MSTFGRSGEVYDSREEDSNGAGEASGRGSVSLGLRRGGFRRKKRERRRRGRGRGEEDLEEKKGREEGEGGGEQEVEMRK